MEISLETDGPVALLRVCGEVGAEDADALSSYLEVARRNGAVRAVLDLSSCTTMATTVCSRLLREKGLSEAAGGGIALCGVSDQNTFLSRAVAEGTFRNHPSLGEGARAARSAAPGEADGSETGW